MSFRAAVEVEPGRFEVWRGDPQRMLTRVVQMDRDAIRRGKRRRWTKQDLSRLARRFRYVHDRNEVWKHPETLMRSGLGDCEDWARGVCYALPSSRAVISRNMLGASLHARPFVSGWPWDWSGLKQLVQRGYRRYRPRIREIARASSLAVPWFGPAIDSYLAYLERKE